MLNNPEHQDGRAIAVVYGVRKGHTTPERMQLIIDSKDPDGILTILGSEDPHVESKQVPVKVYSVGEFVRDVPPDRPRIETPDLNKALEISLKTWANFRPTKKGFRTPLPPLVKQ